jgi:cell wall-associated NlpC family hydrolase
MDEHFGTMLPDYSDEYPTQADAVRAIGEHSAHMEMVTDFQRPGDLVLMNVGNSPCHVGLLVGSDYILHADPFGKQPSRLERISRAIKLRIEGYYRVC